MSLRKVLTAERSRERWIFGTLGAGAVVYAVVQASRAQYGVAALLAATGAAALLAARFCSDRSLYLLGTAAILTNIVAATYALLSGS